MTALSRPLLALIACLLAAPALAADSVRVFTSYPQEMMDRYEQAFGRLHPDVKLDFQWGHGPDAMATLGAPDQGGVDVFWSPALKAFPALAKEGAFRPLGPIAQGIATHVGGTPLADAKGTYSPFELAGYGFVVRPDYLTKHGLAAPRDWADLGMPAYAGHVILPVPSSIGFAPPMIEVMLQHYGWDKGWALLANIAANAELLDGGGGVAMVNELVEGTKGIGLVIDFFVRSAKADGKPVTFVYPEVTAYVPAHVAITAKAPHPAAAETFVRFVLSDQGQALLMTPEVMRLPVRPSVYAKAPADFPRPFAGKAASFTFDTAKANGRQPAMVALFDAFITKRHARLVQLMADIRKAEAEGRMDQAAQARKLVEAVPASEAEIGAQALNAALDNRDGEAAKAIIAAWGQQVAAADAQAARVLAP
jgi:ABC-type Fe3+ transport system substrate-binding protein